MALGSTLSASLRRATLNITCDPSHYDAVVVGAGAAGGLAAWLLTEAGLRVLVLDAGARQSPIRSLSKRLSRGLLRCIFGGSALAALDRRRHAIQTQCYAWAFAPEAFVDDLDCPYVFPSDQPFLWLRVRSLGGRLLIPAHGRQYYRLGPEDFTPIDRQSSPWPLGPGELDPWYALIERRLGLSGRRDGLRWVPDSEISRTIELTPSETALQRKIIGRWPNAHPILGRFAVPFNSLEAAANTGRLLVRCGAIARKIEVDRSGRVQGVVWLDHRSGAEYRAVAPLVFLCASALESTRLLLLSQTAENVNGLGASSGVLGRYLMDHVRVRAIGHGPALSKPQPEQGRCLYLPRFDARHSPSPDPGRGFGVQIIQTTDDQRSHFTAVSFGEMLPRFENRVTLDSGLRDAWNIPVLNISCSHSKSELVRARDQVLALQELANLADVRLTHIDDMPAPPGGANHECGTARMGSDPASSVLDPYNECWDARGLYVTDAACFPSQGTQNPTLTILALTARACDYAVRTASQH